MDLGEGQGVDRQSVWVAGAMLQLRSRNQEVPSWLLLSGTCWDRGVNGGGQVGETQDSGGCERSGNFIIFLVA